MNENCKKLQRLFDRGVFNPDWFYNIEISKYDITLQCNTSFELTSAINKISGWVINHDENGFLKYIKYNIRIVITD